MCSNLKKNILKIRGGSTPPNFCIQNSGGGVATPQPPYFGAPANTCSIITSYCIRNVDFTEMCLTT